MAELPDGILRNVKVVTDAQGNSTISEAFDTGFYYLNLKLKWWI